MGRSDRPIRGAERRAQARAGTVDAPRRDRLRLLPKWGLGTVPQQRAVGWRVPRAGGLCYVPGFSLARRTVPTVTSEDSRQLLFQLVALGDLDKKRASEQRLIDAVPRTLAKRSRSTREAQESLDIAKEKHQGFQARLKTLELDLGDKEAALDKANANLMSAKSNQEYTLLMAEITRRKEEKGGVEESILEQYDVIKLGERMVADALAGLEAARAEYSEFEQRALAEHGEHLKDLAALDERREQVRRAIDPEALKLYDRAYEALGNGIVPAEAKTCQGCFSILTPNDNNRLLGCREVITCRSCQRILYMPEVIEPTSA